MTNLIIDVPKLKDSRGQSLYNAANEHLPYGASQDLGVTYLSEFKENLGRMGVQQTGYAEYLPSIYHLVAVPDDDIFGAIARIIQFHNDPTSSNPPHGYVERVEIDIPLTLATPNAEIGTNFTLKGMHSTYISSTHLDVATAHSVTKGQGIRIAVVDSGIQAGTVAFGSYHDMIDTSAPSTGVDLGGHGTAMATIIKAIAPDAEVHIVRVAEKYSAGLWNTMAGVATAVYDCKSHIINLSLGFQHLGKKCGACGGTGHARSRVFEKLLLALAELYRKDSTVPSPIYVTSTGNNASSSINYPAAFPVTMAVGSVNSKFGRSSFSNYGASKQEYLLLPGGEETTGAPSEWVGEGQDDQGNTTYCLGTSPATAYASGLMALYWANKFSSKTAAEFSAAIVGQCDDKRVPSHNSNEHGAGFLYYH
ncbi:MAG: S8 family serine peptidase [Nitrososphaera sp.]|nr:S8 family serine peptidase [Nitrososphaera sp.]